MTLREEAIQSAPDHQEAWIDALYQRWGHINDRHFSGVLREPLIVICDTAGNGGSCGWIAWRGVTQIMIDEWDIGHAPVENRLLYAGPTLLHECVHQLLIERGQHDATGAHSWAFCQECNRIAATLGLPRCRTHSRYYKKQRRRIPSCRFWPWCVMPVSIAGDYQRVRKAKTQARQAAAHAQIAIDDTAFKAELASKLTRLDNVLLETGATHALYLLNGISELLTARGIVNVKLAIRTATEVKAAQEQARLAHEIHELTRSEEIT